MAGEAPSADDISRATTWLQGLAAENPIELVRLWKAAIEEDEGGVAAMGQSASADSEGSPAGDGEVLEWEPKSKVAMPVNDRKNPEELAPGLPPIKRDPESLAPHRGRGQGLETALAHGSNSDSDDIKCARSADFEALKTKREVAIGVGGGAGTLAAAHSIKPEPDANREARGDGAVASGAAFAVKKESREVSLTDSRGKRKQEASGESDAPRGWEAERVAGGVKRRADADAAPLGYERGGLKTKSGGWVGHSQASDEDNRPPPARGVKDETTFGGLASNPGQARPAVAPAVKSNVHMQPAPAAAQRPGVKGKGGSALKPGAGRVGEEVEEPHTKKEVLEHVPGLEQEAFKLGKNELVDNGPLKVGKGVALKFRVELGGMEKGRFYRGKVTRVYTKQTHPKQWRKGFNCEVQWDEGKEDCLLADRARVHSLEGDDRVDCVGSWFLIS